MSERTDSCPIKHENEEEALNVTTWVLKAYRQARATLKRSNALLTDDQTKPG